MPRPILDESRMHPAIVDAVDGHHRDTVDAVIAAVDGHPVVVVGMGQNPFVGKVKRALKAAGVDFHSVDYGSYFSEWRRRTAIKMWSGWPTFPMIFVHGALVGGHDDTVKLIESGELKSLIEAGRAG